jgi:hypothetical protein
MAWLNASLGLLQWLIAIIHGADVMIHNRGASIKCIDYFVERLEGFVECIDGFAERSDGFAERVDAFVECIDGFAERSDVSLNASVVSLDVRLSWCETDGAFTLSRLRPSALRRGIT